MAYRPTIADTLSKIYDRLSKQAHDLLSDENPPPSQIRNVHNQYAAILEEAKVVGGELLERIRDDYALILPQLRFKARVQALNDFQDLSSLVRQLAGSDIDVPEQSNARRLIDSTVGREPKGEWLTVAAIRDRFGYATDVTVYQKIKAAGQQIMKRSAGRKNEYLVTEENASLLQRARNPRKPSTRKAYDSDKGEQDSYITFDEVLQLSKDKYPEDTEFHVEQMIEAHGKSFQYADNQFSKKKLEEILKGN